MEGTEEIKKCKFCGSELKGDALFCTECGKKIEEEEKKVCTKCGAALAEDAIFCPKCGKKVITSITCPNCGKELQPDAKFCQFCGANLNETLECPKCHAELPLDTKFCLKCGYDIQNTNADNDYEEEKSTKEKITEIIDKYIDVIGKEDITTVYNSTDIAIEQYFQNLRLKILSEYAIDDILGFIDTTVFGKGKNGLIFTIDALYDKMTGGYVRIPYSGITGMYIEDDSLYFEDSDGWGKGICNIPEIDLDSAFYNVVAIKDCLEEIKSVL